MNGLEYSSDALEVKGLFYNKPLTVYVEGPDDIIFWNTVFKKADVSAHIEDAGGKTEIKKMYSQILENGVKYCVAIDNDNSKFMPNYVHHPRIIRTYGYSIENSMYYNKKIIADQISNLSRCSKDHTPIVESWIDDFSKSAEKLIIYDIANNRFEKGVCVFGDNCCRLLAKNSSYKLCQTKIADFIESIEPLFTKDEIDDVKNLLRACDKDPWFLIKGHFISHSLINLIKATVKQNSGIAPVFSSDILYSMTVNNIDEWDGRPDIAYVIAQIKSIPMN